jgi:hypothetical protein
MNKTKPALLFQGISEAGIAWKRIAIPAGGAVEDLSGQRPGEQSENG